MAFQIPAMCYWRQMLCLLLTLKLVRVQATIELSGQSIKDAMVEYTLLDVLNHNQFQGIEFDYAEDGFPAYKFRPTADVKSPYRMLLPDKLNEFAIMTTFLPSSPKGGYLFSVVNPLDTVVQLGLHLSPVSKNMWNVSLLYTQSDQSPISRRLVSYALPYVPKKWTSLAFKVLGDKVKFYYDCEFKETTPIVREPLELVFDSASTLYLAQAGNILEGHFEKINLKLNFKVLQYKMAKETKTFSIGEHVYAKIRGYTPWPARITKCDSHKRYNVIFYGTAETGSIKVDNLFKYDEGNRKFATEKNLKRRNYRLAVEEMEDAIDAASSNLSATEQSPARGSYSATEDNVADQADEADEADKNSISISGNQKSTNKSNEQEELPNNIYVIFLPSHGHCGIKLDHNKPKNFANAKKRRAWVAKSLKAAGILKEELLLGLRTVESVSDCLVFNLQRYKLHPEVEKRFEKDVSETEDALDLEEKFVNLSLELRECLGLENADTVRSLEILHELRQFKLKPIMLIRNPACVDILRRLRTYIGNLKEWNLNAEKEAELTRQAEIIRAESKVIYDKFKKTLKSLDSNNFWDDFCKRVSAYAETCRLNEEHSFKTIKDPTCSRMFTPKTKHSLSSVEEEVLESANADNIDNAEGVAESAADGVAESDLESNAEFIAEDFFESDAEVVDEDVGDVSCEDDFENDTSAIATQML